MDDQIKRAVLHIDGHVWRTQLVHELDMQIHLDVATVFAGPIYEMVFEAYQFLDCDCWKYRLISIERVQ